MDVRLQLALWAGGCFLVGQVAAQALQRSARLRRLRQSAIGEIGAEIGCFVHGVGLPFAAMIGGALPQNMLGLGASWFGAGQWAGFTLQAWLRGIGALAATLAFVFLVVWAAQRSTSDRAVRTPRSVLAVARTALYSEPRWALYRAFLIILFADAYLGSALGFGVALLEQMFWSPGLRSRRSVTDRLDAFELVLALGVSAVLYLATQNLWLMLVGHATATLVVERRLSVSPAPFMMSDGALQTRQAAPPNRLA